MKCNLTKSVVITLVLGCLALGLPDIAHAQRVVRVLDAAGGPGALVNVVVELDAQGNENAVGFSLAFDPSKLSYVSNRIGSAMGSGTLFVNTNSAPTGALGVLLGLAANQSFPLGIRRA